MGYATSGQTSSFYYNPSDARIQCFGLELAIKNRDVLTFKYLWSEQPDRWDDNHFAFLIEKILQEKWDSGLELLFRSNTSQVIYKALNPEDKDNFLNSKIIDKITDTEFWENISTPIKISEFQVKQVITELQLKPYGSYAVLKFPQFF